MMITVTECKLLLNSQWKVARNWQKQKGWMRPTFLFLSGRRRPTFLFFSGRRHPTFLFLSGRMHPTFLLLSGRMHPIPIKSQQFYYYPIRKMHCLTTNWSLLIANGHVFSRIHYRPSLL